MDRPPRASRPSGGHKILSRLPFLRSSFDDLTAPHGDDWTGEDGLAKRSGSRLSSGRRRRGSLRKTAILGTRQRSTSSLMESLAAAPSSPDHAAPRRFTYAHPEAASSSESASSPAAPSTLPHAHQTPRPMRPEPMASPGASPVMNPYASTTDDDDALSFSRPAPSATLSPNYFPLQPSATSTLQRRRSAKQASAATIRHSSPLSLPPATLDIDEWDYSETEWWGWVVLIVTWIVFVVGMGSCLEVWSWAWDVGETPYAPPELEDDPTLPIVGYYPALLVLTAVMAWVWVVVAWVGMKYFRHAKVVGEEG